MNRGYVLVWLVIPFSCQMDEGATDAKITDVVDASVVSVDATSTRMARPALCFEEGAYHWPENGHCYVRHATPNTFDGAQQICLQSGAELVSFGSRAELNAVDESLGLSEDYWIGLRFDGGWDWTSLEPLVFENWAPSEPSTPFGETAFAYGSADTTWKASLDGQAYRPFACEYSSLEIDDTLYQLFHDVTGYELAVASCEAKGGEIVTILSATEQIALANAFPGASYWIGLSDRVDEGEWVWESGEPLDFINWWAGHPSSKLDCAMVLEGLRWGSRRCDVLHPYMCKFAE